LAGGALLRAPTSSFSCNWLGGAIRVVPTGFDFDVRLGGVIRAAPANFPLGVSLSGRYSVALAGVAPALRHSNLLGLLAPRAIASWSFAASTTMSTTSRGCGAVCGIARALVLKALVGAS